MHAKGGVFPSKMPAGTLPGNRVSDGPAELSRSRGQTRQQRRWPCRNEPADFSRLTVASPAAARRHHPPKPPMMGRERAGHSLTRQGAKRAKPGWPTDGTLSARFRPPVPTGCSAAGKPDEGGRSNGNAARGRTPLPERSRFATLPAMEGTWQPAPRNRMNPACR